MFVSAILLQTLRHQYLTKKVFAKSNGLSHTRLKNTQREEDMHGYTSVHFCNHVGQNGGELQPESPSDSPTAAPSV